MKLALLPLIAMSVLSASDSAFDGRWNITPTGETRARAWWLEVKGAGSKNVSGRFVGAPGGQLDDIPRITVEGGQLEFGFERNYRYGTKEASTKPRRGVYRARVQDGKLVGTFSLDGNPVLQFTGVRAPVINDKDDGRWVAGTPITLTNGKDMKGWRAMVPGVPLGWSMKDGMLTNSPGANNLVSEEKFWNFDLHARYRFEAGSNSGIGLRGRYEVQIMDDSKRALDGHAHGSVYSRIVPSEKAGNDPGQWQVMDIRLIGRTVTVKLNGKTVIDRKEIDGLTAMAHDPDEAQPGPVSLQGDHGVVEFQEITVTPLRRR